MEASEASSDLRTLPYHVPEAAEAKTEVYEASSDPRTLSDRVPGSGSSVAAPSRGTDGPHALEAPSQDIDDPHAWKALSSESRGSPLP